MHANIDTNEFMVSGRNPVNLGRADTKIKDVYKDKADYRELLAEFQREINELQRMMYAHDRYGMLLAFQAMDAAGKDGTIRAIMSGVNPHGVAIHAFKRPSSEELEHDFLWRTTKPLPQRGRIGIFNRSYYEEVLITKVHPEIIHKVQKLPNHCTSDMDTFWERRYESIRDFEKHLSRNGTKVVKFFLHLSRDEQRERFLKRIDEPAKNWKFSEGDVAERAFWDEYQQVYESAINATATADAPWYVIPANDKKNMRLIVAKVVLEQLRKLDMKFPEVNDERLAELQRYRELLSND